MPIIDANVILRYLLKDQAEMSMIAKATIEAGAQTTVEVLAEVVYVLKGLYGVDRQSIAESLLCLLDEILVPRKAAVQYACKLYQKTSLDFVDCILAGYQHVGGDVIVTFDKKLNKLLKQDILSE